MFSRLTKKKCRFIVRIRGEARDLPDHVLGKPLVLCLRRGKKEYCTAPAVAERVEDVAGDDAEAPNAGAGARACCLWDELELTCSMYWSSKSGFDDKCYSVSLLGDTALCSFVGTVDLSHYVLRHEAVRLTRSTELFPAGTIRLTVSSADKKLAGAVLESRTAFSGDDELPGVRHRRARSSPAPQRRLQSQHSPMSAPRARASRKDNAENKSIQRAAVASSAHQYSQTPPPQSVRRLVGRERPSSPQWPLPQQQQQQHQHRLTRAASDQDVRMRHKRATAGFVRDYARDEDEASEESSDDYDDDYSDDDDDDDDDDGRNQQDQSAHPAWTQRGVQVKGDGDDDDLQIPDIVSSHRPSATDAVRRSSVRAEYDDDQPGAPGHETRYSSDALERVGIDREQQQEMLKMNAQTVTAFLSVVDMIAGNRSRADRRAKEACNKKS